jgi:hypothetical protein
MKKRSYASRATKTERPWPEKRETPVKFRSGVAGPKCRCCQANTGKDFKQARQRAIRRKAKAELPRSEW